ncbi:hypothetical protein CGCSCA5_v002564 [Colletotrichum siamense]|uniref:uncharacterized protein n=1 Tax=Colletotrichum siamense TaxID=690259 RepID=UPI001872A425|nr:uncharacterized protein CGCS363_v009934 [Colletotrichum siamense]KAF4822642.1 hypothetical protein CGCSCA5_v002564 [Colletotrichum siamense]KAF5494798.1 hypothetical protein CGCS363_v009934 [Colletotrichum siamense]
MQFSSVATFLVAVMVSQTLASPARGNGGNTQASGKQGQPCTGSVANLQQKGTCNANGKCAIEIPPNELDIVASADCE